MRGAPEAAAPEAELWMGAHPSSPSTITVDGAERPLDACISQDPERHLGPRTLAAFGPRLPFLLKVLAAASPLSLQAHPDLARAKAGFARENALGIPLDAPTRSYKDDNHKPEIICALTPFWALSGFRSAAASARVLRATEAPALAPFVALLEADGEDSDRIRRAFFALFESDDKATISRATAAGADALAANGFPDEAAWTRRLAAEYPGDIGVAVALLLNLVRLSPGQALFLDAGNLHAYLEGTGIELMASSDNVLRGGLTPKHVDVAGLAETLRFEPSAVPFAPRIATREGIVEYATSARDIHLERIEIDGERRLVAREGPAIVLVTRGAVEVVPSRGAALALGGAESAYLAHGTGDLVLRGRGQAFRATVGAT